MQRDTELEAFVGRIYDVFNTGDVASIPDLVSDDDGVLGIGTDPREWWVGPAVIEAFKTQPPEMHAAGLRFEPGEAQAYAEGSVGWIADQPTLKLPDGEELPMRFTAVCHQEDGSWKMVQFHLSLGASNEEAIGEELTV
jgi:ketosteroid isomerase-like protein